jgi:hypothetical protein
MASTFTPFFRWFTDEASRERAELIALHNEVREAHKTSPYARPDLRELVHNLVAESVAESTELPVSQALLQALDRCQSEILASEAVLAPCPEIDWDTAKLSMKEESDLRALLQAQRRFLLKDSERTLDLLGGVLSGVFSGIIEAIPRSYVVEGDGAATIPVIMLMAEPSDVVDRVIGSFCKEELLEAGLFTRLQQVFLQNVCDASGVVLNRQPAGPLVTAAESTLDAVTLVHTYLKGTPFLDLFLTRVPFLSCAETASEAIDVFISYSKRDRAIAQNLASSLRRHGITVWWDMNLDAGIDFHDAIAAALDAAKAVVVVWSESAVASRWVRDEADRAARQGKLIQSHLPEFDPGRIPLGFGQLHSERVDNIPMLLRALAQRHGIGAQQD